MLEFKAMEKIIESGYQYARKKLKAMEKEKLQLI
jgi:hypothetical protein